MSDVRRATFGVWIAGKPGRGSKVTFPEKKGFLRIDVTSGSGKKLMLGTQKVSATQLSPLLLGPVLDCEKESAERMENLWQFRKVYPQLGHWDDENNCPTPLWTQWKSKGYSKLKKEKRDGRKPKGIRTPPEISKLKKIFRETAAPWTPKCSWWNGRATSYIAARKQIYVPTYAEAVVKTEAFQALQALVAAGEKLLIIDLDGPPLTKHPNGIPVNNSTIVEALNDTSHIFGHGYVVAALLAGVDIFPLCDQLNETSPEKKKRKVDNE